MYLQCTILNHLKGPTRHRQYVCTSNLAERAFEPDRQRTKAIPHLWDEGSVVKLVFAVLIRVSERWGKKQFSEFEQRQIRILRQTLALDQPWVPEEETKDRRPLLRVYRVSLLVSITQPAEEPGHVAKSTWRCWPPARQCLARPGTPMAAAAAYSAMVSLSMAPGLWLNGRRLMLGVGGLEPGEIALALAGSDKRSQERISRQLNQLRLGQLQSVFDGKKVIPNVPPK
jgi:hypothetical protein